MPILAIDQGTTGSTSLIVDTEGRTLGRATIEYPQHFPQPGWVEHDLDEIWASVQDSVREALRVAGLQGGAIEAIGITNQRETTCIWDKATGRPVHRAIVWQDRRTTDLCAKLKAAGHEPRVRERTGLVLDPYFSATKLQWLLDNGLRERAERAELQAGTIDTFVVHRLSGNIAHVTDASNASRTLLFNLQTGTWDDELLRLFCVPRNVLPTVLPSAGLFARTKGCAPLPDGIPITGVAGDQQAALFGQACIEEGDLKCTYGTGAFLLVNTGTKPRPSAKGLLTTVAWKIGDETTFALEGSAFIAGAAVQWLRDGLGLIAASRDIEALAASVPTSDGVTFVPALSGLGAPHWDPEARGLICGITRGTTRAHLARATLEGIAFSVADLVSAMEADLGRKITAMRVDGGAAANNLMMQFQANVSNLRVLRPTELESTARGAAMLAGLGAGIFKTHKDAARLVQIEKTFSNQWSDAERDAERSRWAKAIARARL